MLWCACRSNRIMELFAAVQHLIMFPRIAYDDDCSDNNSVNLGGLPKARVLASLHNNHFGLMLYLIVKLAQTLSPSNGLKAQKASLSLQYNIMIK